MDRDPLTEKIIGCAIDVHKAIGPGLLEKAYEACLSKEFADAGIAFKTQVPIDLEYKSEVIEHVFRADMIVEEKVLLELKAVTELLPIHQAQLMTYMRLTGLGTGLLMNFNAILLKDGLRRVVL